jgi:hypothetical protein
MLAFGNFSMSSECHYIQSNTSKPDGQMVKGFDVTRMRQRLACALPTSLYHEELAETIKWYRANKVKAARRF